MNDDSSAFTASSQPSTRRRAPGSVTNKSRVTNGRWILDGVDNRSPQARRFRDLCVAYASEVGTDPSEVEKGLIRQAAAMTLRAEALQVAIVRGEPIPADEVIRITTEARSALQSIMSKRRTGDAQTDEHKGL